MATVKEFKEWLNRFPEEAIIQVAIQQSAGMYQSYGAVIFEEIELADSDYGKGWQLIDFRNNYLVKEDSKHFGKVYLEFGEQD